MAYSKAKLKSSGKEEPPYFIAFWIRQLPVNVCLYGFYYANSGPIHPPIQWILDPFSLGVKGQGYDADHSPHSKD
jgi:hypothetical protein